MQNGKNNLVLRQVALAMMQQQQTNPQLPAAATILGGTSTPGASQVNQYSTFATSPSTSTNSNSNNTTPQLIQTTALSNGSLVKFPDELNAIIH